MKLHAGPVFTTLVLNMNFGLLLKARVDQELHDITSLIYLTASNSLIGLSHSNISY